MPSSVGRWSGKFNDGGVSLRRAWRLPSAPSVIGATGVVFVRRAFAEEILSTSAAAWADRCIVSGDSANCCGVLLITSRLSSYSCLICPDRKRRRRWWISWLREFLGSSFFGSILGKRTSCSKRTNRSQKGVGSYSEWSRRRLALAVLFAVTVAVIRSMAVSNTASSVRPWILLMRDWRNVGSEM